MGTRKKSRKNRSRRAVSPVIATVILVAIAITIAVAVAYWMGGIAGSFTKFEQVEIQTGVCSVVNGNWQIEINLKNTGTASATLTNVFVNDVECSAYNSTLPGSVTTIIETDLTQSPAYSLQSGEVGAVIVWVGGDYAELSPGTTVNIKIHSAGGMDYIKLIELV